MSLDNVKQFQRTAFFIPRLTDKQLVEKLLGLVQEGGYKLEKTTFSFTFADQNAEFSDLKDAKLQELLGIETISTRQIIFQLNGWLQVSIDRGWDHQQRKLTGNQDNVGISPHGQGQQIHVIAFAKLVALARKHFGAVDTKPFLDFLDEGTRQLYQSREQDLQKLERMQEGFFKGMADFTLDQQKKQQEFTRELEAQFVARQKTLEEQHRERLNQLEVKEAALKKIHAEIDERENRQARHDIYKELKTKLEARNQKFELTEGTKGRRRIIFGFTLAFLGLFLVGFCYCFYKNVVNGGTDINWIAVGSQTGFALALIAFATFFIRWNQSWFQKHADEEFKLKRLDLDIDRANWLVELAMEWKNITKSEIPADLIDKLARSLFISEETKDMDIGCSRADPRVHAAFPAVSDAAGWLTPGQGNVWPASIRATAASHTLLSSTTRSVTTTWPPDTSQRIPDCFSRCVNTVLQPASVTPLPIGNPTSWYASTPSTSCCCASSRRPSRRPPDAWPTAGGSAGGTSPLGARA